MREQADSLSFDLATVNSTMISYLTDRHFAMIHADPFIFANYYALQYRDSPLSAADYGDLVDFFTICLFRYPFTVSYLLNDRKVDPIAFFRGFAGQTRAMSHVDRNALALTLSLPDLQPYVAPEDHGDLVSVFCLDRSLHLVSAPGATSVLYSGRTRIVCPGLDGALTTDETKHYIHTVHEDAIRTTEITGDLSHLYELQGLPTIRSESYSCD